MLSKCKELWSTAQKGAGARRGAAETKSQRFGRHDLGHLWQILGITASPPKQSNNSLDQIDPVTQGNF